MKLALSIYLESVTTERYQIRYRNLFKKQIWKSMSLDKYLNCGLSLEAYLCYKTRVWTDFG